MRHNINLFRISLLALLILKVLISYSQENVLEGLEDAPVSFRSSQLVNAQTTVMPAPGEFEFHIKHRFGSVGFDKTMITNFLGTDLSANIHFGFVFSLGKNMYVGVGRTKSGKTYDMEFKRMLMHQTGDNKIPVSVAAYFEGTIMSDQFLPVSEYAFFDNRVTPFENKFNHRFTYNSQLIISRVLTDKIAVQVSPVFIYQNLVSAGMDNYTIALPVSGAVRTSFSTSIIFEYAYRFNNKPSNNIYPASIAFEVGTVSHVFQIVFSSNNQLTEQAIYTAVPYDYFKGQFLLGFNIKRIFWYKKKK